MLKNSLFIQFFMRLPLYCERYHGATTFLHFLQTQNSLKKFHRLSNPYYSKVIPSGSAVESTPVLHPKSPSLQLPLLVTNTLAGCNKIVPGS